MMSKPLRVSVLKFSSCDGCQLALLNLGDALLQLAQRIELVYFAEAGIAKDNEDVDIAIVECSISTAAEITRIHEIRAHSKYVIAVGACATSGGIQALRNNADLQSWLSAIYPQPEQIDLLPSSTRLAEHIRIDQELWGCPINATQLLDTLSSYLLNVKPPQTTEAICLECKRKQNTCLLITQKKPCLGPVTRAGCGALCPTFGRACYGCTGPLPNANFQSLTQQFHTLGLSEREIQDQLRLLHAGLEDHE
jgi:sulfhydrogenase subunit delta